MVCPCLIRIYRYFTLQWKIVIRFSLEEYQKHWCTAISHLEIFWFRCFRWLIWHAFMINTGWRSFGKRRLKATFRGREMRTQEWRTALYPSVYVYHWKLSSDVLLLQNDFIQCVAFHFEVIFWGGNCKERLGRIIWNEKIILINDHKSQNQTCRNGENRRNS